MKKFLSLVLALVMTMSLVTVSAGAKDFTDSTKIQYTEAVDVMSAVKVIDGYADGSFNPSATLTRGAAAKIICNLILGPTTASALVADAAPYSDVPTTNVFAGYIAYCQKEGIISGYTEGLMAAVPIPDPAFRTDAAPLLEGDMPSPTNLPEGCRFHPRCKYCQEKCRHESPELRDVGNGHLLACHYPLENAEGILR